MILFQWARERRRERWGEEGAKRRWKVKRERQNDYLCKMKERLVNV